MKKREWQTKDTKQLFKNDFVTLFEDDVVQPDGNPGKYAYFEQIPGVNIIALDSNNSIYFLRQHRYVVKKELMQLPVGGILEGEDPAEVAKNELKEETGITAKTWKKLGKFYVAPSLETTWLEVYLATDLDISDVGHIHQEGNESILEVTKFSLEEVKKMMKDGEIEDGLTLAALGLFFNQI